jgi:hypothetical protein
MNKRYKHFDNRRKIYLAAISILIGMLIVPAVSAQEDSVVAVKAGTILPVTSTPIQNGIVLIRNGKIEAVGKNLKIPDGAKVIDATDKVVMPGLIFGQKMPLISMANIGGYWRAV